MPILPLHQSASTAISPDGSEKAVAGFTVTVRDADGNAVATTRTNGEGVYKVENLTPGDYSLDVAAASGYAFWQNCFKHVRKEYS